MDKKKFRALAALIAWGIVLYVLLNHLSGVLALLVRLLNLTLPLLLGGIMAFVLNVPMHGVEVRLSRWQEKHNKKIKNRFNTAVSAIFTFLVTNNFAH